MPRRLILFLAFCCTVTLFPGPASAQTGDDTSSLSGRTSVTGIVQTTTATSITILEDSGNEVTLAMDSGTALPRSMEPGSRVRAAIRNDNGEATAGRVTMIADSDMFASDYATTDGVRYANNTDRYSAPARETRSEPMVAANNTPGSNVTNGSSAGENALPASDGTYDADELPATASPMPFLAVMGLFGLIMSLTMLRMSVLQRQRNS